MPGNPEKEEFVSFEKSQTLKRYQAISSQIFPNPDLTMLSKWDEAVYKQE